MDISRQLSDLEVTILESVSEAAHERNLAAVAKWSRAAEHCEALVSEAREFEERIRAFKNSLEQGSISEAHLNLDRHDNTKTNEKPRRISAKREGAIVRAEWVKGILAKGISLKGYRKRYQTTREKSVGLAFANELHGKENKWWLGLQDDPTDVAVLLCRSLNKDLYDIVLPVSQLRTYWDMLSRSGGQIKFNIRKEDREFFLLIPGDNPLSITKYAGNYEPLR